MRVLTPCQDPTSVWRRHGLRRSRRLLDTVLVPIIAVSIVRGAVHIVRGDEVIEEALVEFLQGCRRWSTESSVAFIFAACSQDMHLRLSRDSAGNIHKTAGGRHKQGRTNST